MKWWKIDESDILEEAKSYKEKKFSRSSRGFSTFLLLFASILTGVLIFYGAIDPIGVVDIVAFLALASFIAFGHRWAMIAAMVLWTFERTYGIYVALAIAEPNAFRVIMNIIFWVIFMKAFYVSFKVEQKRKKLMQQKAQE